MTNQEKLQRLLSEINSVSEEDIIKCDIPLNAFIGEAFALHTRASEDFDVLSSFGVKPELLKELIIFTEALQVAQANWEGRKTKKQVVNKKWQQKYPKLKELRKELLAAMQLAYRFRPDLLSALKEIRKGNTIADTLQDLSDLSVLGRLHKEPLEAINFDFAQFDMVDQFANETSQLASEANDHRLSQDEIKLIRDKAYTKTRLLVDEIRLFGKYAFRNDHQHRKYYHCKYHCDRNARLRRNKKSKAQSSQE